MRREVRSFKLPRLPRWARQTAWTLAACVLLFGGCNLVNTGWPIPIVLVDRLDKPVAVTRWNREGLCLVDGRTVMPEGMIELPAASETIRSAIRHGVEVARDGRVYGLIKYWHWCGNDPVRYDLRRVDIAQLLAFHKEGLSRIEPGWYADAPFKEGRHGWPSYSKFEMAFDPRMKEYFESRQQSQAKSDSNSRF